MPAEPRATRSAGVVILATLAIVAALYAGQELLVPVALAILFTGLLRPLVRQFERAGLSAPIGSIVILVIFLGLAAVGVASLTGPVRAWVAEAPDTFAKAQVRLRDLRKPLQTVTTAVQKLENGATGEPVPPPGDSGQGPGRSKAAGGASAPGGSNGNVATIAARVFGTTTAVLATIVEVLVLTFLLLASGDSFLAKLVRVLPVRREKRELRFARNPAL